MGSGRRGAGVITSVALVAAAMAVPSTRGDVAARADDTPSVCRGVVRVDASPRPWRSCDVGRLTVTFHPICTARRVHLVYVLDPSSHAAWSLGLVGSVNQLNLGANPNIHAAAVLAPAGRDPLVRPLEHDITRIQRGLDDLLRYWRPTPGPGPTPEAAAWSCGACGIRTALDLLQRHRADAAPDTVAEYIAYFGTTDPSLPDAMDPRAYAELGAAVREAKGDGVTVIAGDRALASDDGHWIGGLSGLGPTFSRVAVDNNGTQLREMDLSLRLPEHTRVISYAVQPPGYRVSEGGRRLTWGDPPWSIDGVTLSLAVDVLSSAPAALDLPRLEVHLRCYRGRARSLTLPDPAAITETLGLVDGCRPAPTTDPADPPTPGLPPDPPTPGAPPATRVPGAATTAAPTRTPWPTPTGGPPPTPGRRPGVAYLPIVSRDPCGDGGRPADVVLVLDTSTSMRGANLTAAVDAARAVADRLGAAGASAGPRPSGPHRLGLVVFDQVARILAPPAFDLGAVRDRLDDLARRPDAYLAAGTRIDLGLHAARDALAAQPRPGAAPIVVMLTDGVLPERHYDGALAVALDLREVMGAGIYAVGLGTLFDARFLEAIAGRPDHFAPAVDPGRLGEVMRGLAVAAVCGE